LNSVNLVIEELIVAAEIILGYAPPTEPTKPRQSVSIFRLDS
jgi:hypothetical protein